MRYFASIGTDLVCNGIQSSEGDVIADNVIEVTAQVESGTALDDFIWRKYENGAWSAEKFEPTPPPTPTVTMESLQAENESLNLNNIAIWEALIPLIP